MKTLTLILASLMITACGEGLSFREGDYAVEIECIYNDGGPLPAPFINVGFLSKSEKKWGFAFLGQNWSLAGDSPTFMESYNKCETSGTYITMELTPTELGFEGMGYTFLCQDDTMIQEKVLTGELLSQENE